MLGARGTQLVEIRTGEHPLDRADPIGIEPEGGKRRRIGLVDLLEADDVAYSLAVAEGHKHRAAHLGVDKLVGHCIGIGRIE